MIVKPETVGSGCAFRGKAATDSDVNLDHGSRDGGSRDDRPCRAKSELLIRRIVSENPLTGATFAPNPRVSSGCLGFERSAEAAVSKYMLRAIQSRRIRQTAADVAVGLNHVGCTSGRPTIFVVPTATVQSSIRCSLCLRHERRLELWFTSASYRHTRTAA